MSPLALAFAIGIVSASSLPLGALAAMVWHPGGRTIAFLMSFGGSAAESDPAIPSAKVVYILDTYEVVFSHGPYLVGVREATAQQPAEHLALQLYNRIKEASRESDDRN